MSKLLIILQTNSSKNISDVNKFLVENFGFVGVVVITLAGVVTVLSWYIYKLHKAKDKEYKEERDKWREERKDFRASLDKNTEALNRNTTVIESLKTLFETLR